MNTRISCYLISLVLLISNPILRSQTPITSDITSDTWLGPNGNPAGTEYIISGTIRVYGTDGDDQVTTLYIEPGVKIKFTNSSSSILQIGYNGNPGQLIAEGTSTDSITFTSAEADPQPGDWRTIHLTSNAKSCKMDYVNILFGGMSQGYGHDCALKIDGDSLVISHTNILKSQTQGICLESNAKYISADHLLLEDNGRNGILDYNGANYTLSINNSQATNNGEYGINIARDIDLYIQNSTFGPNTLGAMKLHPNSVGGIAPSNSFTAPGLIEVISGDITRNAEWPGFFATDKVHYYINNNIKVYGTEDLPAVLKINPGAELRFAKSSAAGLAVGYNGNPGQLIAEGTSTDSITFTSAEADPQPGDWRTIHLTSNAKSCKMDYVNILFGGMSQGYGHDCALKIDGDSLVISHTNILKSQTQGICLESNAKYINADHLLLEDNGRNGILDYNGANYTLSINNSQTTNNGEYGINIARDIDLSIQNSTFGPNTLGAMKLHPNSVGGIAPSNSFTAPGLIEVISGDITRNAEWPGFFATDKVHYYINNNIKVYGTEDLPAVLQINPGAELRFAKSSAAGLAVGYNGNPGQLIAEGTSTDSITFTSAEADPQPGDWRTIHLTSNAKSCKMDYVNILFGGMSQGYGHDCALKIDGDSLVISHTNILKSQTQGICLESNAKYISADHLLLEDNGRNGILDYNGANYTLSINNSQATNNGEYGINIARDIDLYIQNSTFGPNTLGAMKLHPNSVGGIAPSNSFTAPGLIEVISGDITRNAEWPGFFATDKVHYYINNNIKVYGTEDLPAVLQINPGAELRFAKSSAAGLAVGYNGNPGQLIAEGTSTDSITFTSAEADPQPGDWRTIHLTSNAKSCKMDYVNILFGGMSQGYGTDAGLRAEATDFSITNSVISQSGTHGMVISGAANPYTFDNRFINNQSHGLTTTSITNEIDFSFNTFMQNAGSGCNNSSASHSIDASFSNWGSADGPAGIGPGTGDEATGNVIIDPWAEGKVSRTIELESDLDSLTYMESRVNNHVITGLRWEVSGTEDWISIPTSAGVKTDSFYVNFNENIIAAPRTAHLTIASGDTLEMTFTLTQPAAPASLEWKNPGQLEYTAGSKVIDIQSNFSWNLATDCDWLSVDPAMGEFNETVTVTFDENVMAEERNCTLTITGGGISDNLQLVQAANPTSMEEWETQPFNIYPNPVTGDYLVIKLKNNQIPSNTRYKLVNMLGQVSREGTLRSPVNNVDISGLGEGVYLLTITNQNPNNSYSTVISVIGK